LASITLSADCSASELGAPPVASKKRREEQLRASSLATITADVALSDHWNLVAEAMNAIWSFTHDHVLFNAAGASIKLALSGYYQKAFDQLRDVVETWWTTS
jgi:hypothetical protein